DSVTPARGHYGVTTSVSIGGYGFTSGGFASVDFGGWPPTNVEIQDTLITCDVELNERGQYNVTVNTGDGTGMASNGFVVTPAIVLEGDFTPGGSGVARYLLDPYDSILAIIGLPPPTAIPTPPFVGDLCIAPFYVLFVAPRFPLDELDLDLDIPDDPSLSGIDVLFQALIGPDFRGANKDAAWTNCATLSIR